MASGGGNRNLVSKMHRTDDPVVKYISEHSLRLHPAQQKLIDATKILPWGGMLGDACEMQLLMNLVKLIKGKKTLDVGVYTGYSALSIAMVLPEDGKVIACDISDENVKVGIPFWKEAGVDNKIDFRLGPATETLKSLLEKGEAGTFDFAFIDADKVNYENYYEMCLELLRPGGVIALDNVLWGGKVTDPSADDVATCALRNINAKIAKDQRVDVSMLNIGDGTTLAFKR